MSMMDRKEFLVTLAGMTAAGAVIARPETPDTWPDFVAASADESAVGEAVSNALEALGGIGRFVKPGSRVMLLPNPQGRLRGASTRPEIVAEVIRLCKDAGAGEIKVCTIHGSSRWGGTGVDRVVESAGVEFWGPGSEDWREISVPGRRIQESVTVIGPAVEYDVVINLPIAKQHDSTRFTGNLKNLMGTNRGNSGWHTSTDNLTGSIVDLASVVRPALTVMDATTILAENGPFGPGRTISPGKIIASSEPVAADSYACGLLGMKADEVATIREAAERGLGRLKYDKVAESTEKKTESYVAV